MDVKEFNSAYSGEPGNYIVYDPDDEYEIIISGLEEDQASTVANMLTTRETFHFTKEGRNYVLTDDKGCLRIVNESESYFELLLAYLNR